MQIAYRNRLHSPSACVPLDLSCNHSNIKRCVKTAEKITNKDQALLYKSSLVSSCHKQLFNQHASARAIYHPYSSGSQGKLVHTSECISWMKRSRNPDVPLYLPEVVIKPLECVANEGQAHLGGLLNLSA